MPPEMTLGQLATLGISTVGVSFLLNWVLLGSAVKDFRGRLERIERGISGEKGLQVRVAVLEDRRTGPADRRDSE